MSNALAIAVVTSTLRHLLQTRFDLDGSGGVVVTTRPPDKVRESNGGGNQVNLFLYQTQINAAWRNMDMPGRVQPGETGQPPLALNLYYLLTAYAQTDDFPDPTSHQLLGTAMSVLHDHMVLSADDIRAALPADELLEYDLQNQVERVRITPQPMGVDELSKLWMMFQTQYRISTTYEVSVVLIESLRPTKTPLPVLQRGQDDRGVAAQPDLIPPFPTLTEVVPPNQQPSARLGDTLTLKGFNLDGGAGSTVVVRFAHPYLATPIERSPTSSTGKEVQVLIPDTPTAWIPGFYTVAVVIRRSGQPDQVTNELPLALSPRILTIGPSPITRDTFGTVTLTITCSPDVKSEQRVTVLVGDREATALSRSTQTNALTVPIPNAPVGEFFIRLRVDGVDSLLIDRTVTPPVFDATQKVTLP